MTTAETKTLFARPEIAEEHRNIWEAICNGKSNILDLRAFAQRCNPALTNNEFDRASGYLSLTALEYPVAKNEFCLLLSGNY